jgi:hypothetical protein
MEPASQPPTPPSSAASRWRTILPLLAAVLVMLTFVTIARPPSDLNVDTDTSLNAVLNYANQHRMQFGTDLVCTYGPLGYLEFFYYSPHAAGLRLAVETALCLTVALGLCLVAWPLRLPWRCLLLGIFIYLVGNVETRTDLVIDSGFLCWGLLCIVESGRKLTLAAAILTALAIFGALAKVSILLGASLNLVLLAGLMLARRQTWVATGMPLGFMAGIILGWIAAGQDLSHLGSYLVNALAVVRGYNQTLGWEALPSVTWLGLVVMVLAVGAIILRTLYAGQTGQKNAAWYRGLLLAWTASLLFLSWKHGLARGDAYHVAYFFGFVPVLVLALESLPADSRRAGVWARLLGILACLLSIIALQALFFAPIAASLKQPFRNFPYYARALLRPGDYCQQMNEAIAAKRNEARLPSLRKLIGSASMDVFGDNAVYAIFNDLNYRPRPVFLSYLACTRHLMDMNERFYLSAYAPEYVMFSLGGIDRRFAPLEDALVLRDLLINYEPVGGEGQFALLKRGATEPGKLALLCQGLVRPGERIDLRGFGKTNLWLEIKLAPSVTGLLRESIYRPPPVRLAAWREPGQGLLTRRRAPAPMLAAGFLASPILQRNQDVLDLYADKPVIRPAAYSLELLPGQEHFWNKAIRFRLYAIQNLRPFPAP